MSRSGSRPPLWPSGFITGIGRVPGGPRMRVRTSSAGETEIQIATGSLVIVPKTEEQDLDLSTLPTSRQLDGGLANEAEEGEPMSNSMDERGSNVLDSGIVKFEANTDGLPDLPEDYQNHFARLIADHHTASQSGTSPSRRQETYNGPLRDRTDSRLTTSRERHRSRSPTRAPTSAERRPQTDSPMFFPEARGSHNSTIGTTSTTADSRHHTSTPTPDPPSHGEDGGFSSQCRCPIDFVCLHRRANLLDCRPLVREWVPWKERQDQEAFDRHRMAAVHGDKRTTTEDLISIVGIIDNFVQAIVSIRRESMVREMQGWIMAMEDVTLEQSEQQEAATSQVVPALTQFLLPENTHVRRVGGVPSYIEEELTTLNMKWGRGDFDGSLHRGLDRVDTFDVNHVPVRTRLQVNRNWPHHTSGLYFGAGSLVNGQLWMTRAELQRDGVHAPPMAGISGTSKKGAYSIVLGEFDEKKNEGYADIDMGEKIDYVGTALKDEEGNLGPTNEVDEHMSIPNAWDRGPNARKPTAATQAMMTSLRTGQPVRVIRSWKMCDIVKNKPRKGYRYDGLYRVVGETALKEARQIWSFQLERLRNQGGLRGFARNEVQPDSSGHRKGHFYRERRRGA